MNRGSFWHADPRLVVRVRAEPWVLSRETQDAVESSWEQYRQQFFRGPVLSVVGIRPRSEGTVIDTCWTDYAHFLYSSRHLAPEHPFYVRVLFAAGCLVTTDGYLLAAVNGPGTSRVGWIQAVGGSPEPTEVSGGWFDPVASVGREMREETGFDPTEGHVLRRIGVVGYTEDQRDGSVAVAVKVELRLTVQEALARFKEFQRQVPDGELSDLCALPLGEAGIQQLRREGRARVRYLEPLLLSAELRPEG